jgi:hypothetical protein
MIAGDTSVNPRRLAWRRAVDTIGAMRDSIAGAWIASLVTAVVVTGSCALDRSGALPDDAGAGGQIGSPGSGGQLMQPCDTPADCFQPDSGCGDALCINHVCSVNAVPAGVPCGDNVVCDGEGNCVECLTNDQCEGGTCTCSPDCAQMGGETCENGTCTPVMGTVPCGAYVCGPDACLNSCDGPQDCAEGFHCTLSNQCVADTPRPDGSPCTIGDECMSGNCVDMVCCDAPCDAGCFGCTMVETSLPDGQCGASLPGTADAACVPPAVGVCDGQGMCLACGTNVPAPGGGSPSGNPCVNAAMGSCTMTCGATSCLISCSAMDACSMGTITCPEDYDCTVECTGNNSCEDAVIQCPTGQSCVVTCPANNHKCDGATIDCPTYGTCTVTCGGGDTCDNATVNCGANTCIADCVSSNKPDLAGCLQSCNLGQGSLDCDPNDCM